MAFHIQIDSGTVVTDQKILCKGVEHAVKDIISLEFWEHSFSINSIPASRTRFLVVYFADGRWINPWTQHPLLRRTKFANIEKAYQALVPITFNQRCQHYVDQWRSQGFFDYQKVRIYSDGTVSSLKELNTRLALKGAFGDGRVLLGENSADVWIYDRAPGFFGGGGHNVKFQCRVNRDVIMAILHSLAE